MIRLTDPRRVARLIDDAIERLHLDLTGLRVLTEAASGAFVVTALIAARAGAACVHAVTRDSVHGRADDVVAYGREWAATMGVGERIQFHIGAARDSAAEADIVTNLGFVRPLDRLLVERLPRHAVICLMWEPWEFRSADIDLSACAEGDIPVIGTCETDARLRIFDYVGALAVKLLLEDGLEGFRSRVLVIGSDPFGAVVQGKLAALGADVDIIPMPESGEDLDRVCGERIERADALVLAEHRDQRLLVGNAGGIRPDRFLRGGCRLIHIAGCVDDDSLESAGIAKRPARRVPPGYMTLTTDYVGPRPVVDLHTGGLKVGELAVRERLAGRTASAAVAAAVTSGLGLALSNPLREAV